MSRVAQEEKQQNIKRAAPRIFPEARPFLCRVFSENRRKVRGPQSRLKMHLEVASDHKSTTCAGQDERCRGLGEPL
jgi:hypothetical protein